MTSARHRISAFSASLLLTLACACAQATPDRDEPPAGYRWVEVDPLAAAFLLPDGWRAARSQGKLLAGLSLFEPPVAGSRRFSVGLTVNAVDYLGRANARPLARQLTDFVAGVASSQRYQLIGQTDLRRGAYRGVALDYRTLDQPPLRGRRLYLVDEARDRLLIIQFEAPQRRWRSLRAVARMLTTRFELR